MKKRLDVRDHRALALWAADCAAHVLRFFEGKYPRDGRPRNAIEVCRAWGRGKLTFSMKLVRAASLDAHAAARRTAENEIAARAAARAAGQAVATLHVPEHARGAAAYAVVAAHGPAKLLDLIRTPAPGSSKERDRQLRRLPRRLWTAAFPQVVRKDAKRKGGQYGDR